MDNTFFFESTIEDSFIYKTFNASNGLIDKIVKYIRTSAPLDSTYIEEQYMQIKKSMISPLSNHVLEAFDAKEIELLYSREVKIGNSIPYIVRKNANGRIVVTIFIASFAVIDVNSNSLNIPVKQLYALMESAYVALQMQVQPMKIQRNISLMKICCSVYNQMVLRILNKEYALSLDKILFDKVSYCINRFFLESVWQYPSNDTIEAYATSDLKYISEIDLSLVKAGYDGCDIKSISDLLDYVKSLSPRMNNLNIRYYIERYVNTYHGSSIMSIDYLPYIFFVIINILLGSFLISQNALNDIIKNTKNINKFYIELSKLI